MKVLCQVVCLLVVVVFCQVLNVSVVNLCQLTGVEISVEFQFCIGWCKLCFFCQVLNFILSHVSVSVDL